MTSVNRLLIDTDPGVDDALAILMAYAHQGTQVEALTITAGNVGLAFTVRNALKLLEVIGADTPVFVGAGAPLVRPAEDAAFVHGNDGFGDIGFMEPERKAQPEHAALAMIRLAHAHPGELSFVMLGPLTNLALALTLDSNLPSYVKRLVVMGGAVSGRGNTSRIPAEFNTSFDPEAAHIVFSRWPIFDLVDWEATLAHGLPFTESATWLHDENPRATFYRAISRKTHDWMQRTRDIDSWHAADALAMAAAIAPEHAEEWITRPVAVELDGTLTRGATVVDWFERGGKPAQARILQRYDLLRFKQWVRSGLGLRV